MCVAEGPGYYSPPKVELNGLRVLLSEVLQFDGRLDTKTSPDAQTALDGLIGEGVQKILVDFEELDYVSSAGLRVLLSTAKQLSRSGGELRLSN